MNDYQLIIIGGGVIGVELAYVYSSLGCQVTIIEALNRLIANMDKEIGQSLAMILKKKRSPDFYECKSGTDCG